MLYSGGYELEGSGFNGFGMGRNQSETGKDKNPRPSDSGSVWDQMTGEE